jgi:chromate transporter
MAESTDQQTKRAHSLLEIAKEFLRLGFVAFGGPPAHIAMIDERFVRRLAWVTGEQFLDLVGAVNLLPGPSSTELASYLGQIAGGLPGLLVAGACFILPAAILVVGFAWAYMQFGAVPQVAGLLFGIKPVVVALIAQAIWNLGKTALKSTSLAALAVLVVALAALGLPVLLLLIAAGVLWMVVRQGQTRQGQTLAKTRTGVTAFLSTGAAGGGVAVGVIPAFLYFLKVGAVLFGSGYVLLAVLRADLVVRLHWLTDGQLLDAIAVSQATPGPFFTVATFIGYLLGGWKGAALTTLGMFLPAFVYVAAHRRFRAETAEVGGGQRFSRRSQRLRGSADGICRVAIHARCAGEHPGDGIGRRERSAGLSLQSEFPLARARRRHCRNRAAGLSCELEPSKPPHT